MTICPFRALSVSRGTAWPPATDSGGTWANLSTASKPIQAAKNVAYNLLGQFSATCFYFAAALTDVRSAAALQNQLHSTLLAGLEGRHQRGAADGPGTGA